MAITETGAWRSPKPGIPITETVHHAQAKLPSGQNAGRGAAEAEAHDLAERYVSTGEIEMPRFAIDLSEAAADTDARELPGNTAAMYLYLNSLRFLEVLRDRLVTIEPVLPAGLSWQGYSWFAGLTFEALKKHVGGFDPSRAEKLGELVQPHDIYAAVDSGRIMLGFDKAGAKKNPGDVRYGALGHREWSDAAGRAFAATIETSLRESVTRMASGFLAASRRKGDDRASSVSISELVMSHLMDRLTAPAVTARGVLEVDSRPWQGNAPATPRDAERARREEDAARQRHAVEHARSPRAKNGLRLLDKAKFEWQGSTDRALWNWVKVSEPNATAEEVANAMWGGKSGEGSVHAHRLTAAPPYFGLPESWAAKLPGAKEHAPKRIANGAPAAQAATLAGSSVADEVAIAQAKGDKGAKLSAADLAEPMNRDLHVEEGVASGACAER